jgi:putative phosphoribosyl transferase
MIETVECLDTLIAIGDVRLEGELEIPEGAAAIVAFAHGSGSNRLSPRNREVAGMLHEAGMATLLFDLLTEREAEADAFNRQYRFDIPLLAERLLGATDWLTGQPRTRDLPLGYFGASTGAAAALVAAAERPQRVRASVSRGGRPDLAHEALRRVRTPTLLIVGSQDTPVIELNRQALAQIKAPRRFELVPGASHLFEEPGTLEDVAHLAQRWFAEYLTGAEHPR